MYVCIVFAVTPNEGFIAETLCNEVGHYLPGDATWSNLHLSVKATARVHK